MKLLLQLPRLPFSVAFDILFRHGGFAAFVDAHPDRQEGLYQFWRLFFVSSSVGKLHPETMGQWVEVMCVCHIVQSLPHPAHAIYLLRPIRREIPESSAAWGIAGGRGNQLMCPETLVRAMKLFIPVTAGSNPPVLLQREWFWVADFRVRRSLSEWLLLADEVISSHVFTKHWWMQQREGPFFLLGAAANANMGSVIECLAMREAECMKGRTHRKETLKMEKDIQHKLSKKNEMRAPESGKSKASSREPPKTAHAPSNQRSIDERKRMAPPAPKEKPPTPSHAQKQEIISRVIAYCTLQISVLSQASRALASMDVSTLDHRFKHIACLVVSLGCLHPRIKWRIRKALHDVAFHTGRSTWDIERELYRWAYRRDSLPLEKLVRFSTL